MYTRILKNSIKDRLFKGKIIILYGLRQVGKTTLIKEIVRESNVKSLYLSCDIPSQRSLFNIPEPSILKKNIGDIDLLVLDEAQEIENIGLILKVFYDIYPNIQIIATGSSSFDLSNKIKEPLTGRAVEFMMYPLSIAEIMSQDKLSKINEEFYMKYGLYPGLPQSNNDAEQYLQLLQNNTLYKDMLIIDNIKKPKVLEDLLIQLADRIGSVLSIQSIANEIKTTHKTVERYIDILEKMFVIVRLYAFSKNPNNERKKGYKVYFTDIGIRNSIIKNHNDLQYRNDVGQIFENYWVMERVKYLSYNNIYCNKYYWQDYKQTEVDYIEERNDSLNIYECKWKNRNSKGIKIFEDYYKNENVTSHIIDRENYINYIT